MADNCESEQISFSTGDDAFLQSNPAAHAFEAKAMVATAIAIRISELPLVFNGGAVQPLSGPLYDANPPESGSRLPIFAGIAPQSAKS